MYKRQLSDISGTGAESTVIIPDTNKVTVRLTGSVSDIKLVKQGDEQTVTLHLSGAATDIALVKDYENTNLFDITGEMQQGIPVYTPSWISPKGDQTTEEYDWGLITATPTQPSEDWGPINTNDETIPKVAENWGFLLPAFNYVQIGGQHYPNRDTFSLGESSLVVNTGDVTGIATFLLSEDLDIAAAIQYESSGKSGIATHNAGLFFSGELWLSQAQQHTVFGEEGQISITGTGAESITPFIPEGSGSLFKLGGAAESSTKAYLVGDYQYLSGTANVNFAPHITGIGTGTFSQGREPGQTYSRVINHEDDAFGGTLNLTGIGSEVNTESYNESSIKFGQEDEYFGELDGVPAFGFSLGIGNTTLPSFDADNNYNLDFASNVISEDRGTIGFSSVGGRPYTKDRPFDVGFTHQEGINRGYEDAGWVTDETPSANLHPFGTVDIFTLDSTQISYIPNWVGSGTLTLSGISVERVAVASSTTSLFDFVSGAQEVYSAQTPEGTVLFDVSGIASERTASCLLYTSPSPRD